MEKLSKRAKLDANQILESIEFMLPLVNENELVIKAMNQLRDAVEASVQVQLKSLPAELIVEIIKYLTPADRARFCSLSKRFSVFCNEWDTLKRLAESKLRGTKDTILLANLDTHTYVVSPDWKEYYTWRLWTASNPPAAWQIFTRNWKNNPEARVVAFFSPSGREIPYVDTWRTEGILKMGTTNTGLPVKIMLLDRPEQHVWFIMDWPNDDREKQMSDQEYFETMNSYGVSVSPQKPIN
uniref:F-box domain-containing protein n=1 Tax=viral metagenome TaxID=1070528 RepID=A0A6C0BLP4_9ZZZZ